ncbi:hypothetical protein [Streptomyces sp. A5-4]|uniref:hypothetical protein n=1 Tax=Streptomyces sp. A5-4 TaxID=3384771 RepID=UPI003DA7C613
MDELPQLEVEGGTWYRAVPPSAVPMPAAQMPVDLHGQRAVISEPGIGILHDLRILGSARQEHGVTWLDVVPELDYWRTKISPGPVATRCLPIDQIYIEHRLAYDPPAADVVVAPPAATADPASLLRRLAPRPDMPGVRTPVPARGITHLHGRRIIQVAPLGFAWDLRAVSEPYQDSAGDIVLNLTAAYDYYRWVITGAEPDITPIGLYLLWTE